MGKVLTGPGQLMKIGLIAKHLYGNITLSIAHGHEGFDDFFHCRALDTDVLKVNVLEMSVGHFDPLVAPQKMAW